MKTIKKTIIDYTNKGLTRNQAENCAAQEIILRKISKSPIANNVLIKGGVVMYNLTNNLRRTTSDLDFDFIRYDISDASIDLFVDLLNKYDTNYRIDKISIKPLRQEDYQGKEVWLLIYDKTASIRFKLDIGVHTLLAIEQNTFCFSFDDDERIILKVNPPEQVFAEKLYSLAKHGFLSTRFKDVYDMYYFIVHDLLDNKLVKRCLELLLIKQTSRIKTIDDICNRASNAFSDETYIKNFMTAKDNWIEVDYKTLFNTILNYIYNI